MTVNYNLHLSDSRPWALFRILLRWRGSIWKLVLIELVVFLLTYTAINTFIHYVLPVSIQSDTISVIRWFKGQNAFKIIPIEFMLGFFVSVVVQRWSKMINEIGFIDCLALTVANYLRGDNEHARILRRNVIRYCCLSQVFVFRDISTAVRKRFPTIETIAASVEKLKEFEGNNYSLYWLPINWALTIVCSARREKYIDCDIFTERICQGIRRFRDGLENICRLDWIPLPLAYPQLIYLAVHVHFLISLISKQEVDSSWWLPRWIPLITLVQFFFYMAWTKVAMVLINPFGEDDDDFETNSLIDRNFKLGIRIVDNNNGIPEQKRDFFWNTDVEPLYSEESVKLNTQFDGLIGSAAKLNLSEGVKQIMMIPLRTDRSESMTPKLCRHTVSNIEVASIGDDNMKGSVNKDQKGEYSLQRKNSQTDGISSLDSMNQNHNVMPHYFNLAYAQNEEG